MYIVIDIDVIVKKCVPLPEGFAESGSI